MYAGGSETARARNLLNGAWQGVGAIAFMTFPLQRDNHLQVHDVRDWVVESQVDRLWHQNR